MTAAWGLLLLGGPATPTPVLTCQPPNTGTYELLAARLSAVGFAPIAAGAFTGAAPWPYTPRVTARLDGDRLDHLHVAPDGTAPTRIRFEDTITPWPGWLAAARGTGRVTVLVVPPGSLDGTGIPEGRTDETASLAAADALLDLAERGVLAGGIARTAEVQT